MAGTASIALWPPGKMRDSALLVTWSSPKTTHRRPHMWAIATNVPTSWQKAVHVCHKTRCRTCWAGNIRAIAITRRKKPVTSLQPLIESFTHPNAIVLDPFAGSGSTCVAALSSPDAGISVSSCLSSITVPGSNALPPCNGPCSRGPRMMTGLCRRLRK